jgi:pimeloyl-ACP methyl ester carboxylesterase
MTMSLLLAALVATAVPSERPLSAAGPLGPLSGTLTDAGKGAPVILVIPGSGPTDRDGNNPLGVKAAPYRLLAEALAARGVSSVRIDKRGLFESKKAAADPNKVTIADYVTDTNNWVASVRHATGANCVWLLGHSEGGLIALTAAQHPKDICGVIAVAAVGRRLGDIMRQQLRDNPANAPILEPALATIDSLEAGKRVDSSTLPAPLQPLFDDAVQPFLIDLFSQDPARLAAGLKVPLLIVQGDKDIQVTVEDAKVLAAAQPKAKLAILPGVNHVLKIPQGDDRVANLAAYANPDLPIAPSAVDAIADFVKP